LPKSSKFVIASFDLESAMTTMFLISFFILLHSHNSPGKRVFNVTVEGTELPAMDLFQLAGTNNAYTKTVTVSVTDGKLTIVLTALVDNGSIAGLEIIQSGTAAPIVRLPTNSPVKAPVASPTPLPPSVAAGKWIPATISSPGFKPRLNHCVIMVDNPTVGRRAYLIGGYDLDDTDIYNPMNGTWTKGAKPPVVLHHIQCVAAQGKVWIMAPYTGNWPNEITSQAYMYDPATNTWTTKTPLPVARRRGSAAVVGSLDGTKIYVSHGTVGGHKTDTNPAAALGYLDEYDIATDSWKELSSSAPHPRDHAGGAMVNGMLCVAGGRNSGVSGWPFIAPTDCYNFTSNQWENKTAIPQLRARGQYGRTCDGKLIVAGGDSDGKVYPNVDVFDGTSWVTIDDLDIGRHSTGMAIDCVCNQIHVITGSEVGGTGTAINSMETYFPSGVATQCLA
jgi:Malectin domain